MKKIFDFGKIDYTGTGRKTDIVAGGQCLDIIARYIKTPLFKEIYRLWKLYHLNDMHPECEHQAAQGWTHEHEHSRGILGKPCPVCGYKYGHGWNYFPIPEQDEQAIYKLLEG